MSNSVRITEKQLQTILRKQRDRRNCYSKDRSKCDRPDRRCFFHRPYHGVTTYA